MPTKAQKKDTTVILRLTAAQKQRIQQVAQDSGATLSEMIREMIDKRTKSVKMT